MTSPGEGSTPRVGYLVNQYPKGSHTFVRREIMALEEMGWSVFRVSVRRTRESLSDEDAVEDKQTQAILSVGPLAILWATLLAFLSGPPAFLAAVALAFRVARRSEKGRLYHLIYLAEACVLRGWLKTRGIAHVHAHFGTNSATVAMLCAALGGTSYSFTIHGPEEFDKAPLLSLAEKVARARFVAVISSFGRSQLFRYCDSKHWDKIVIVPCGLDKAFLTEPPTPVPPVAGFVCVGRLSEQKGHVILCQAIAKLAADKVDFHVTFIGDGELRGMIEGLIQKQGLAQSVTLAGWKNSDEVKAALRASRGLVLPSFAEGLPVVLMESLALGRPVITTYIAGIPELVQNGVNGWLVPAGDVDALVAAMKAALQTSAEDLSAMGAEGRSRVLVRHDIAGSARLLAGLFAAADASPARVAQIFQAHTSWGKTGS